MSYLCINDLNSISNDNIYIKEINEKYKIFYKCKHISLNGIIIPYNDEIYINDKYIKFIANEYHKHIDEILSKKIKDYNSFIKNGFITIQNNKINEIFKKNINKYYLNLSYINKYNNNTPVLYIVK